MKFVFYFLLAFMMLASCESTQQEPEIVDETADSLAFVSESQNNEESEPDPEREKWKEKVNIKVDGKDFSFTGEYFTRYVEQMKNDSSMLIKFFDKENNQVWLSFHFDNMVKKIPHTLQLKGSDGFHNPTGAAKMVYVSKGEVIGASDFAIGNSTLVITARNASTKTISGSFSAKVKYGEVDADENAVLVEGSFSDLIYQ